MTVDQIDWNIAALPHRIVACFFIAHSERVATKIVILAIIIIIRFQIEYVYIFIFGCVEFESSWLGVSIVLSVIHAWPRVCALLPIVTASRAAFDTYDGQIACHNNRPHHRTPSRWARWACEPVAVHAPSSISAHNIVHTTHAYTRTTQP